MKKIFILLSIFTALQFNSIAFADKDGGNENRTTPLKRTCKTKIPSLEWENDFQQKITQYLAAQQNPQARMMTDYTIPVVVHIVYWNATQNISQAQVNSQIDVLNKDYAGIGLNVGNVPTAFASLVANTNIQFCLAQKKPDGTTMDEAGIDRVDAQGMGFSNPGTFGWLSNYVDATIKPATIWDPTKYCNIWVLPLEDGTLGYATFPAASTLSGISAGDVGSNTDDGVVIGYIYFGDNIGTAAGSAPYNRGRTVSHEIGHWLGLRHIWGDSNCGTDYCNDTPTQQSENYDCPTFPKTSCGNAPNGEMFMNFMDYTDDVCMYMFTPDQRTRIQTAMANGTYRLPLASSSVCNITPQAPVANFSANRTSICPGNTVTFTDLSANAPTSWQWTFPSGTPSSSTSRNPTITYNTAGTYDVTLKATNTLGNNTLTKTGYIVVGNPTGASLPFSEGFQSTTFPPTGWSLSSPSGFNWTRSSTVGGFGTSNASVFFNNYDNDAGKLKDDIITPSINLTGATNPKVKFDVAYAPYIQFTGTNKYDTLEVLITDVCSGNNTSIYKKGGTQLATANATASKFTPTAAQWRQDSTLIPAPFLNKVVKVTFRNYGLYDNNIYLYNINLYISTTNTPTATASFSWSDTTVCLGGSLTFTNTSTASSGSPDSVRWTINGGTPSTSNSLTTVSPVFNTAGTYTISLVAYKSGNASTPFSRSIRVKVYPTVTVNSPAICAGSTATLTAGGAATYSWTGGLSGNPATTPVLNNTTTYTVTGTTDRCSKTAVATVTVNALPNVTVNSPTICSGKTAALTAGGATTYTWTGGLSGNPATTPVLSNTTTYTVTGTTSGCSKTAVATVTVTPLPNVTVNSPAVCSGQTASLTANGATSYTWTGGLSGNPVTTPALSTTTTYTVTGTSSGCSKTAVATVTVSSALSVTVNAPVICAGTAATLTANGAATYTWTGGLSGNPATTPVLNSTTTYTVTGNNGACSGTAIATVTVTPLPNITVNSPTICSGKTATLTAGGGTTYTWTGGLSGNPITTPVLNSTTTYTVTGTSNSCSKTAIATVTVNSTPATPNITQSNDTLYSSTILAGATYEWYKAGILLTTTNFPFLKISTSGVYTVKVINGTCTSTLSANFNASLTAVKLNQLDLSFAVIPNPNNGLFEIKISSAKNRDYQLKLFNVSGQVLLNDAMKVRIGQNTKLMNVSGLEKGMYFISIIGEEGIATQNIIVQ
ncbi:MAG: PKD domain-containing protein [Chitinophagales bacterium]